LVGWLVFIVSALNVGRAFLHVRLAWHLQRMGLKRMTKCWKCPKIRKL